MIEELYIRHKEELERFARAISRDGKEAEDLLQETFLRALAHAVKLGQLPEASQRAWLYKVLRNILYDRRRKDRREVPLLEQHEPIQQFDFGTGMVIDELLQSLPPKYRDMVRQRYLLGLTCKQIASRLGIPHATARYRLHSALKLLKARGKSITE